MNLPLLQLAFREGARRPIRTALAAGGVAIATFALMSVVAFLQGYQRGMRHSIDSLGAHVLLVPKGCPFDAASIALHGANWPCFLRSTHLAEIAAVPMIDRVAPVLMTAIPMPSGPDLVVLGITDDMLRLRPSWRIDGHFPRESDEILIGAGAALRHGWKPGDRITLGRLPIPPRRVTGLISPGGTSEDGFVFLPLHEAQRIFHREQQLTHVLARLRDPDQLDEAVTRLRGCNAGMEMNVVPLSHLFRTIQQLLHSTRVWLACVALVTVLTAVSGVGNAILMSIGERTRELGILRAVGASRGQVFLLVWLETLLLTLAGSIVGGLAAVLLSARTETWLRSRLPMAPTETMVQAEPWWIAASLLIAFGVATVAGLLPAWRAATLPPAIAMRIAKGR